MHTLILIPMALLASQVARAADCGDRLPSGAVAWWSFAEDSGTTTADGVGSSDGTLENGTAWTDGICGPALSFDGVDDYVDVGVDPALDLSSALTISAWVWFNVSSIDYSVWGSASSSVWGQRRVALRSNGVTLSDSSSNYADACSAGAATAGEWVHYVTTWDGADVRVYWDGIQVWTEPFVGTLPTSDDNLIGYFSGSASAPGWGHRGAPWFMDGSIDELVLYDSALSDDEVVQLYEAGLVTWIDEGTQDLAQAILDVDRSSWGTARERWVLMARFSQVPNLIVRAVDAPSLGARQAYLRKATRALSSANTRHFDGCDSAGAPDTDDWVLDCTEQATLTDAVSDLAARVDRLMP